MDLRCLLNLGSGLARGPSFGGLQQHRYPGDLSDHVNVVWKQEQRWLLFGSRVGLHQQLIALERAPAAGEPVTVFQKINRSLKLVRPTATRNFSSTIVDQHQRSRPENWKHRPV